MTLYYIKISMIQNLERDIFLKTFIEMDFLYTTCVSKFKTN
ncbi:hypothetical protein LEP1GSC151_3883 [Leptospira interrogans serovar Grippotyphosa str. LT2186]|uniref:Uncharacterized protein n=1 Tax=Leptospira interrogans serovar Grippotyphosa str. LT2186 TaxID=1001599 RepID=M3I3K9_LEPIR|nr:hypothetical protein LEP1GSC151_3883 [Leptospira interrogans serovar Grippotyphosa str. LT2186]